MSRPAWTDEGNGVSSRTIKGVSGIAGSATGATITWQLTDLQGTLVAGVGQTSTGLAYTSPYSEYGRAVNADDSGTRRYGWTGGYQRPADNPGGLIQMGARLYVPGTGTFTSADPIPGASANAYGYCSADPVNCVDTSGKDQHCKRVWFFKLCSVVVNESWWWQKVRIARDRCSHWSGTPCRNSPQAWLRPGHSSREFWEDNDSYRWFGWWIPVWDGWTAEVRLPIWGWS